VTPVRIPHPPATNEQWKLLRALCKQAARAQGKTGRARSIEAARLELDAIAEASHRVRDPAAVRMIATKPEPEGFARTPGGLLVPPPR
jgi:hypothetical protein